MFWGFGRKSSAGKVSYGPNLEPYRAFTKEFDREVKADELYKELRTQLPPSAVDLSTLRGLLRSPTVSRIKATERAIEFQARLRAGHALGERPYFTLLIDHSGSMSGAAALSVAVAADVVLDIFEHQDWPLDILGFTTSSWRGGHSKGLWRSKGRPDNPERLCDLLHIVYRNGSEAGRSSASYLPLIMIDQVLKENVDGEALEWARARAEAYKPSAWVCVYVSDGVPRTTRRSKPTEGRSMGGISTTTSNWSWRISIGTKRSGWDALRCNTGPMPRSRQ